MIPVGNKIYGVGKPFHKNNSPLSFSSPVLQSKSSDRILPLHFLWIHFNEQAEK